MDVSRKYRNIVFPGAYNEFGPLPKKLSNQITDYLENPTHESWVFIMDIQLFPSPSATLLDAMRLNPNFPSLDKMMSDEVFPTPEELKQYVYILLAQRAIEIEAKLSGLDTQYDLARSIL